MLSALGESIADDAWQHLELSRDSGDKPLRVEAVSFKVWPAQGWRQDNLHEQVWVLIERRQTGSGRAELRYFFSNMPQYLPAIDLVRFTMKDTWQRMPITCSDKSSVWIIMKAAHGQDGIAMSFWCSWHMAI